MVIDLAMQIKDEIKNLITKIAELNARIAELESELLKRDKGIERLKKQRDEAREELRSAYGYMLDMSDRLRAEATAHER